MTSLSPTQKIIFHELFKDLSMKEIAGKHEMATQTVDSHATRIYKKFEVNNRVGLILRVLQETKGVLPLDIADKRW